MNFHLQITDPNDPLLLYDMTLSSTDFQKIKKDLKLFCDFPGFPEIAGCLLTNADQDENYRVIIDECDFDCPTLVIEQVTKISLLIHLQLSLVAATDTRLKEFLSQQLVAFQTELTQAKSRIQQLETEISGQKQSYEIQVKCLEQDIKQISAKFSLEKEKIAEESKRQRELEKLKYERDIQEKDTKRTQEIEELQQKLLKVTKKAQDMETIAKSRAESIETLNIQLTNLQSQLQETKTLLTEAKHESSIQQNQINSLKEELQNSRISQKELHELRTTLSQKETQMKQMQEKIAELTEKASDRDWIAVKSKDVIMKEQNRFRQAITQLNEVKAAYRKLEVELRASQNRECDAEARAQGLSVSLEQTQNDILSLTHETNCLKDQISSIQRDLDTERQYSEILKAQLDNVNGSAFKSENLAHNHLQSKGLRSNPAIFLDSSRRTHN